MSTNRKLWGFFTQKCMYRATVICNVLGGTNCYFVWHQTTGENVYRRPRDESIRVFWKYTLR